MPEGRRRRDCLAHSAADLAFPETGAENAEFLEFDSSFFASFFCDSADHDARMSEWASKQQKSATQSTVCDYQLIMLMHPVVAELDRDCAAPQPD